ncbi:DUF4389 domain-containing protein [Herbaspirillum sp. ST 5-3]|uniref:DUF4389 domain-containing protein n=1 Tax=Oxalobacteraceae TaxID=75682 RepID=UPI0010A37EB8|nr:DUF4389 domain-containing protein [Herbaspirillum sp. ST 5-3]
MAQHHIITTEDRNILVRGLFMLLLAFVYQLSGTVLFCVAVIQFLFAALNGAPNARLLAFGRNLSTYLRQIARFLTFSSEDLPFPFSDWPSGD